VTLKRQGRQHGFAGLRVSGREFCTHWKLSELGWTRSTQMDSALSTNTTNSSVCLMLMGVYVMVYGFMCRLSEGPCLVRTARVFKGDGRDREFEGCGIWLGRQGRHG
jgi:hypothetical protein